MNFIDAVRALKEGECEGIKSLISNCFFVIKNDKLYTWPNNYSKNYRTVLVDEQLGEWELVDAIKKYEEVEVVRYLVYDKSQTLICGHSSKVLAEEYLLSLTEESASRLQIVEMKGKIKKEVKAKVKHREDVSDQFCILRKPNCKLFMEWEE